MNKLEVYKEPKLEFAYGQAVEDPRDGLTLFGPFDKGKVTDFSVGVIGTKEGRRRLRSWLKKMHTPTFHSKTDFAKPFFPGFESTFGIKFNIENIVELDVSESSLTHFYKYT